MLRGFNACHGVPISLQRHRSGAAGLLRDLATIGKRAARVFLVGRRNFADELDALPLSLARGIGNRRRGKQGLRVRMPGRPVQFRRLGQLDYSAQVHHADAMRHVPHDR